MTVVCLGLGGEAVFASFPCSLPLPVTLLGKKGEGGQGPCHSLVPDSQMSIIIFKGNFLYSHVFSYSFLLKITALEYVFLVND